jgi:hypothetical protein
MQSYVGNCVLEIKPNKKKVYTIVKKTNELKHATFSHSISLDKALAIHLD